MRSLPQQIRREAISAPEDESLAMRVLGIESSCDETGAAVVVDGRTIRSNVVATQVAIHQRYGGLVPEVASRQHLSAILPVLESALKHADRTSHQPAAPSHTHRHR